MTIKDPNTQMFSPLYIQQLQTFLLFVGGYDFLFVTVRWL